MSYPSHIFYSVVQDAQTADPHVPYVFHLLSCAKNIILWKKRREKECRGQRICGSEHKFLIAITANLIKFNWCDIKWNCRHSRCAHSGKLFPFEFIYDVVQSSVDERGTYIVQSRRTFLACLSFHIEGNCVERALCVLVLCMAFVRWSHFQLPTSREKENASNLVFEEVVATFKR